MRSKTRHVRRVERILAVYSSAIPDERLSGDLWYRQANSLSRALSVVARVDLERASGVLAALSPLNKWDDNVSDAFRLARSVESTVRTTHVNKLKAVRLLAGERPEDVLRGRKVVSFWRSILDPDSRLVAADRHLCRVVDDRDEPLNDISYTAIERSFIEAADLANIRVTSLAATVWLVSRQRYREILPLTYSGALLARPSCCGQSTTGHGWYRGKRRYRCRLCLKIYTVGQLRRDDEVRPRLNKTAAGWEVIECTAADAFPGYPVREDERGRAQVCLGSSEYANGGGWQYLSRFLVADSLGRALRKDEHVHHIDGDLANDAMSNLTLVSAVEHGRHHVWVVDIAGWRDDKGRFVEHDTVLAPYKTSRGW